MRLNYNFHLLTQTHTYLSVYNGNIIINLWKFLAWKLVKIYERAGWESGLGIIWLMQTPPPSYNNIVKNN